MTEQCYDNNLNKILNKLSILYIEDEINIRENVKKTLLILCNKVFDVESINDAKEVMKSNRIDIIISDINLQESNGIEFVKELRVYDKKIPIILLSAYTDKKYLLEATKLKLVDYLTKPIDFSILKNSLLKSVEEIVEHSRYIINFSNEVHYNVLHKKLIDEVTNKEIPLTSKELDMIDYLIKHSNRIISHEELKLSIWQDSFEATDSALKNLLNKVRKKIGKESITNISGVGYRINFK